MLDFEASAPYYVAVGVTVELLTNILYLKAQQASKYVDHSSLF